MKTLDLTALLRTNPYPGRGIVLGRSLDDTKAVIAYFIMGRSENSRNRVFVETPDGIRTQAHDPSKMTDPLSSSTVPSGYSGPPLSSPTAIRPTPSGRGWRRARPSPRPFTPAPLSPTAPTTPPGSPAC